MIVLLYSNKVIFRHFFSVGIGNELLQIYYNFNYPIQSTKLITFLKSEMQSIIEVMCLAHSLRRILNCKCIDFFAVQHILMLTYRSLTVYFVRKYYER